MTKMTASEAGKLGWLKGKEWRDKNKGEIREIYSQNPKKCKNCDNILPYEKRRNKYCNHSCAAQQTNLGVSKHGGYKKTPCGHCGKTTNNPKFCSSKCFHIFTWEKVKHNITENGFSDFGPFSAIPKRYLLETRGHQCEICKITEWVGQPTPIVLDHINGNSDDWRIHNLRLICPNCDAQTSTYKGKNAGNGRHFRRQRYQEGKSY